jgi:hypothetical protein
MRTLNLAVALSLTATALLVEDAPASAAPTVATKTATAPDPFAKPAKVRKPKKVADVSASETLAQASKAFGQKLTQDQLLGATTLSVRKPYADDNTFIWFNEAIDVAPDINIATYIDWTFVLLNFRAAADLSYFVQCKVSVYSEVYSVSVQARAVPVGDDRWSEAGESLFHEDFTVSKHQINFAIKPNGARDISFAISGKNKPWDFQSCKITPVRL